MIPGAQRVLAARFRIQRASISHKPSLNPYLEDAVVKGESSSPQVLAEMVDCGFGRAGWVEVYQSTEDAECTEVFAVRNQEAEQRVAPDLVAGEVKFSWLWYSNRFAHSATHVLQSFQGCAYALMSDEIVMIFALSSELETF